jgi:hypothetical protein
MPKYKNARISRGYLRANFEPLLSYRSAFRTNYNARNLILEIQELTEVCEIREGLTAVTFSFLLRSMKDSYPGSTFLLQPMHLRQHI